MKENLISENGEEQGLDSLNPEISGNTFGETFQDDPEEFSEWQQKSCCSKCCHYLFCCCCCTNYEQSKNYFKKGWRKYLFNLINERNRRRRY